MMHRKSRIQEIPSVIRNKNNEKRRYPKKAYFFPKMFDLLLKLEKSDEISSRIAVIDEKKWTIEITGDVKKDQKLFLRV